MLEPGILRAPREKKDHGKLEATTLIWTTVFYAWRRILCHKTISTVGPCHEFSGISESKEKP